jgi:non-specific serine/threonine protein kinase
LERLSSEILPDTLRARTLQVAATLAYRQGDWHTAQQWLGESLALFRSEDDRLGVARVLFDLGWITIDRGNWAEGIRLNRESLALARAAADSHATYQALTNLGWAGLSGGEQDAAETLFGEALEHAQRIGHVKGVAVSLANLSWVALYHGDLARTTSLAQEGLRLCCLLGEQEILAECLDVLAIVAVGQGDACRGAQLGGAADAIWQALHITRSPADHLCTARQKAVASMRATLAPPAFDAAWDQGRAMGVDAAVALALGCRQMSFLRSAAGG